MRAAGGNHRPPTTAVRRGSFQWRPARGPAETDQPPPGNKNRPAGAISLFFVRQHQTKVRAFTWLTLHLNLAALGLGQMFYNGEPQAGAAQFP